MSEATLSHAPSALSLAPHASEISVVQLQTHVSMRRRGEGTDSRVWSALGGGGERIPTQQKQPANPCGVVSLCDISIVVPQPPCR